MKASVKYRIHRTIAIIVVPLLIISTATGFFRANQKWYWEDGYKKKKHTADFSVAKELVPVHTLTRRIDSLSKKNNKYQAITIQPENESLYYQFTTTSKEKYLADAYTGEIVSPLDPEQASGFAAQYVKGKPGIKSCELLTNYVARKGKEKKPVYKIDFDNEVHSQVYLDYYTGEIIEDIDDKRKFGLWMIRLHEYDFFDSKRSISSAVGIGLFLLALSGLWIYRIRLGRKKENSIQ